jgi:RNA chaperone Hfq
MNSRLRDLQSNKTLVDVYLVNGVKLVGNIQSFDDDSLHLTSNIEGGVTIERHTVSAVQKHLERKGSTQNANR